MKIRSLAPEILDERRVSPKELDETLRFLSWANRKLGGVRALRKTLEKLSWTGRLRILDVGTGDADVPRALIDWARAQGRAIEFVALDCERDMLALARQRSRDYPEITLVQADATAMPFSPNSFDLVTCTLFFHHLSNDAAVRALRAFAALARRGVAATDLLRHRRLYAWTWLLTRVGNSIVKYDGPLSVRKSFTLREIRELVQRTGVPWLTVEPVFGHRFLLAGQKPPAV